MRDRTQTENPGSGLLLLAIGGIAAWWGVRYLKETMERTIEARMQEFQKQTTVPK